MLPGPGEALGGSWMSQYRALCGLRGKGREEGVTHSMVKGPSCHPGLKLTGQVAARGTKTGPGPGPAQPSCFHPLPLTLP